MSLCSNNLAILTQHFFCSLRAQSQSRATWETLSQIKNPPIAGYVKQANFSAGHQQVNNFCSDAPARTRENKNEPNELLEVGYGERLDSRTTGQTSAVNSAISTRPKTSAGKSKAAGNACGLGLELRGLSWVLREQKSYLDDW